ncbi:MAG: hypothetical protein FE78DRAFT_90701 [Acidomyces sp. 'richmondensis']|nr:MAG: hypothetical protein FE78DRAFT_90701 [Acidomyces sp. 'richmondensis']
MASSNDVFLSPPYRAAWMHCLRNSSRFICNRCVYAEAYSTRPQPRPNVRCYTSDPTSPPQSRPDGTKAGQQAQEEGALSRRLAQMSEEYLEEGGKSARKAVEEAGFSEDLKQQLQEKIAKAKFMSDNASAFASASIYSSAGRSTRDIAAAQPWTGTESVEDASLRMLMDAHKPLRQPARPPGLRGPPPKVDTGRPSKSSGTSTGTRLANARDRSSAYSFMKDSGLSEQEREKLRQEMRARFQPGVRDVPATIKGLSSLANERIEDAIARGLFKNLPRGKSIQRDYNASSPFIDTTEYFMNKMIQKQDIVPPWIEKQQELVSTATKFRSRLRTDWRRHVARTIASKGGSLERQIKLADAYALAERRENPFAKQIEQVKPTNPDGHLSQITLAGELKFSAIEGEREAEKVDKNVEPGLDSDGTTKGSPAQTVVAAEQPEDEQVVPHVPVDSNEQLPKVSVFRDPQWEKTEASYLRAAIDNLNKMTRSYNLMAPDLAKKPYFNLERELQSCYADVAPSVASAIRERALTPKIRGVETVGHRPGGVLEKFSADRASHVYDERKPQYGLREFWRDLFSK